MKFMHENKMHAMLQYGFFKRFLVSNNVMWPIAAMYVLQSAEFINIGTIHEKRRVLALDFRMRHHIY